MKKLTFIYASAAALLFAGCASDDLTPGAGVTAEGTSGAIGFNFNVPNQVRGTLSGKDAATKLGEEFVVYGTKHVTAEDGTANNDAAVFTNYVVRYKDDSANSTESNTHNWEYNGLLSYKTDTVKPVLTANQTVKYWDYSAANGYTFTAFSARKELKEGHVTVTKTTADPATADQSKYKKGYTVKLTKDANLDNIFYSDRVEVPKASYGQPVVLTFRNFGTRVRVGFYETVPGYSVKIDKFYYDADAAATSVVQTYSAMDTESDNAFAAALHYVAKDPGTSSENNTITVTYNASGTTLNQPTLTNTTCTYTNTLTLGGNINSATAIATSSTNPTWDKATGDYTTVYPNEANVNPMLIRCDYTLTSTDGSNEKIQVKNARVVVPAEYLKWKPNFAYTYIFKISDKTNGTTGKDPENPDNPGTSDDPEGLHPITFDAVVVDATTGNQETVSGITTNSVTTYANGSKVETNDEYKSGEPIYVVDQKTTGDHAVITPGAIGTTDGNAQVYKLGKAATEGEVYAQLTGAKMDITMTKVEGASIETTVPLNDGTSPSLSAVKFTPTVTDATYFAYVYTGTEYKAPTFNAVSTDASATYQNITYYFKTDGDDGVYYTASGISDKNFDEYKSKLYKMSDTDKGTPGVYDIKVIKVKKP